MNMFKKNGGFTLVELIVVIAILAILAGVAVPAYTGYINKAKEAADTQVLSAVHTAALAACATKGAVEEVTVNADLTDIAAKVDTGATNPETVDLDENPDFAIYFGGNDGAKLESDTYKTNGATWTTEKGWQPTGAPAGGNG